MLNVKQEKFVQNMVNGMSQRQAYKDAYNAKYKDKDIDTKAYLLFKKEEVQNRYKQLISKTEDKSIMSAIDRKKFLTRVLTEEHSMSDKLKAMEILNKMSGEYITKVEAEVNAEVEINIMADDADED